MICPNGHVQPDGARFCGVCGARTPVGQTPGTAGPPVGRTTVGTTVAVVVGVVVLALLVGAGAAWMFTFSADEVDTTGGDDASSTTTAATVTSTTVPPTAPPQTAATTVAPTATTTITSPRPTVVTTPPAPATSAGRWITSLASVDEDDTAGAQQKYDELSAQYGDVYQMRTSDYASLTPGFIVIYRGPFSSGDAALAECFRLGRTTRHLCFAAPLTQSSADRDARRYPD